MSRGTNVLVNALIQSPGTFVWPSFSPYLFKSFKKETLSLSLCPGLWSTLVHEQNKTKQVWSVHFWVPGSCCSSSTFTGVFSHRLHSFLCLFPHKRDGERKKRVEGGRVEGRGRRGEERERARGQHADHSHLTAPTDWLVDMQGREGTPTIKVQTHLPASLLCV